MRNDLQYDLCPGCGERSPEGMGIIAMVQHGCSGTTVVYRPSQFTIRHLYNSFLGIDPMASFKSILVFNHFKKMPDIDTASELDKLLYGIARDSEVKTMKRLRAYIELEEEFDSKY